MKRDLFVFTFMAFVAVSFFCATAVAQTFSPPIPVGAKYDGTLTTGGIKSEATHLRFFNHPTIPGTNFSSSSVEIDGKKYNVDELMATPGWISKQFSITENDSGTKMVLGLPGRVGKPQMAPLHGVCPGNTFVKDPVSPQIFADCRLWPINNVEAEQNYVDRRLEIARIRNTTSSDPMLALIGDPLLDGVVGDASEDQSPYSPMIYPALVDSETGRNDDPFKPWWMLKYPDAQGYKQTISYGLDEIRGIGGLHVTTVYDPFDLGITAQVATGMVLGNKIQNLKWVADIGMKEYWKILWPNRPAPDASEFGLPFYSPVGFFLSVPGQGVKFAGYTALHQVPKDSSGYTHRQNPDGSYVPLADEVTRRAARYSANFGPVAVVAMDYSSSEPHRKDGFAVVNQGTLMSLDDYVIALGIVLRDSKGNPLRWRDVIGIVNADGSFSGIAPHQMPHSVISYVPFWARSVDAFTGKPIVAASSGHLQDTGNPNFAFDPFRVGLVGPGMFYAAKMTDKAGGAKRHTLVVPSGEAADDGNFYVYKLDPIGGPQLRMKLNPQAAPPPMGGIAPPMKLPLVLPEAYRVDVPDGFAPYQVAVADVWKDNDGCDDIILSFRGRITEHPFGNDAFRNEPGQTVLFRTSDAADPDNALAMFASEVRAYKGIPAKVGCAISSEQQDIRIFNVPRKFAQLAAIAVDDFDGDRIDDLLVGDLTPRQIGSEGGTGKKADEYTGYAWLFPGILSGAVNSQAIRTGFFSKKIDEPTGDWLRMAVDSGEIEALPIGPGAFASRSKSSMILKPLGSSGEHIAAINGLPLALPPFGCSDSDDASVVSPPELITAHMGLLPNPDRPQRCQKISFCDDPNLPFVKGSRLSCCDPCKDPFPAVTPKVNECQFLLCYKSASNPAYNEAACEAYFSDGPVKGKCVAAGLDFGEIGPIGPIEPINACKQDLGGFEEKLANDDPCCVPDPCACSLDWCVPEDVNGNGHADEIKELFKSLTPKQRAFCRQYWFDEEGKKGPNYCLWGSNDTQDDGEETAFASAWKPDVVIETEGDGIISASALSKAQFQMKSVAEPKVEEAAPSGTFKMAPTNIEPKSNSAPTSLAEPAAEEKSDTTESGGGFKITTDVETGSGNQATEHSTGFTQTDTTNNDYGIGSGEQPTEYSTGGYTKADIDKYEVGTDDQKTGTADEDSLSSIIGIIGGVNPAGGLGFGTGLPDGWDDITVPVTSPRFPRGQIMPGYREITVVLSTIPTPPEYTCAQIGLGNTMPDGTAVQCVTDNDCMDPTASMYLCDPQSCQCVTRPLPDDDDVTDDDDDDVVDDDDDDVTDDDDSDDTTDDDAILEGETPSDDTEPVISPIEPIAPIASVARNECVCRQTSFPSNSFREWIANINKEYVIDVTGLQTDGLVGPESKVTCVCTVPNSVQNGAVNPSGMVQMSGMVFKDFVGTGRAGENFVRETVTDKIQLLPAPASVLPAQVMEAKSAGLAKMDALISASSELSGAVPMANLGGTYQVGGRKTIINNVLSHEAFSAGATGYSISSSDATFNIAQDETASVHRYDFITMPLCPMFTQVDGYQEDCMVGEWPSMKLLEKVKGEMESRMAAGAKGLDILAGTSWPQTYDNQFIHLQTNTAGGLDQVPLGFLVTDFMGAQGGGCNCDMTGSPIALPTLIVILLSSAAMMGGLMLVRVRIRRK